MFQIKVIWTVEEITFEPPFEYFFENDKFNDFLIICDDNVRIRVNRIVLAANSSVFKTMFNTEMIENDTREMKLDDIDGTTMKEFIRFLYTGKVDNMKEVVLELMNAAEKYQVNQLKEFCASFMIDIISIENVCDFLICADLFKANFLAEASIEFIIM